MSDLAPIVAATLRDKVMSELLEENRVLREKKHALGMSRLQGQDVRRCALVVI